MKKTKITIITKSMEGGIGSFALSLSKLPMQNSSYQVNILCFEKPHFRKINLDKYNIKYFTTNEYPQKYYLNFSLLQLIIKEFIWLKNEVYKSKTNIIVSIDIHGSYLSLLLKLLFFNKKKVIVTYHIDASLTSQERMSSTLTSVTKQLGSFLLNKADYVIGVSKGISEDIKKYYSLKRRIITIYNGYTTNTAHNEKLSHPHQLHHILTISRLSDQKDINTLIDAFNILQIKLPMAKLTILGDGPLRYNLEKKVEDLNLTHKINFIGWKQNILPYLKIADIFVLSSKREGFPYVLLEAMSQGLPIVATDSPYGPSEALDNGKYGLLVPPGNSQKMNNAMYQLLTNKKLASKYSTQSLLRSKHFTEKKMLQKYTQVIRDCVGY